MPTVNGVDESNLRLTGNKINLVHRPIEKQSTASSRCALLGKEYSRSLSAVPLLNLHYNEFDISASKRRPLSADIPASALKDATYRTSMSLPDNRCESLYMDGETSLESSEDIDNNLSSNELLNNLLSEPIYSWRNGIRTKPTRKSKIFKRSTPKPGKQPFDSSDSNETPSAGSDTSSSNECDKTKSCKMYLSDSSVSKMKTLTPSSSERNTGRSEGTEKDNVSSNKVKPHSPMSVTFYEPVVIIPDSNRYKDEEDFYDNDSTLTKFSNPSSSPESLELDEIIADFQATNKTIENPTIVITSADDNIVKYSDKEDLDVRLTESSVNPHKNSSSIKAFEDTMKYAVSEPYTARSASDKSEAGSAKTIENTKITEINNSNSSMVLVPGLKTKPPLPKKPDINNSNSTRVFRKDSSRELNNDATPLNISNFEAIALDMLNCNVLTSQHDVKIVLDEDEEKGVKETSKQNVIQSYSSNTDVNQSSTTTLNSDIDPIELKFQSWFKEEQKANDEIIESEFNTDLSLHKLKVENKKITENIDEKQDINKLPNEEIADFNEVDKISDLQNQKRNHHRHKKNFIKENIKLIGSLPKRYNNTPNFEVTKGKGFVATPMKSFRDYQETNQNREMDSWMSSNSEGSTAKTSDDNDDVLTRKRDTSPKPTPYLNFLDEIDELQECCEKFCADDLPHKDKEDEITDQSDANTYDDIVSILQVLEEQDKKSHMKMESIQQIIDNEITIGENEYNRKVPSRASKSPRSVKSDRTSPSTFRETYSNNDNALNVYYNDCDHSGSRKIREQVQSSRTSLNSSANLNDIFSYLDEVDRNCAKSLACAKERIQTTTQVLEKNIKLDTIPKLEELLAHTNVELAHHIIDLSLRLKDKSSSIALLQKELSSLRNQITKMTKDTNETVKQRLKSQKEDYENVVKRHQKFIDQLIADKKTLNQQCEGLLHEMKVLEDRFNSNLKATEHKHKVELQKVKEMQVAGEKFRRERWIDTKTQKIKELTVKGLEPELDKMAARHQQELNDLRALHKREIEDLELRSARKMQQQCESLREQLTEDREKAIAHEREVLRQRYEQLVSSEEQNYQEQRRRLLSEHASRIAECEERETAVVIERDRAIKQAQNDFEDKLQAAIRKHNTELNVLKEKTELEIEGFRNNYKKQASAQLAEKEMQIREKCRKERDREIEAVIERLETEFNENKLQIDQTAENRIKRLKEKYEKEISDLECSERESTTKYSETKTRLLETEDTIINLKANVKHLEGQLRDTKELSERLSNERNKIKEVVREEMKQEVLALEKEVQSLRKDKDKELQQVYARVKVAVARKDETISELTRDHTALQEKCAYLENMLEQQRKEYLMK